VSSDRGVERDEDGGVVVGWALPAALVRSVIVEVSGVLVDDRCGVRFVVDQDPVGALSSERCGRTFRRSGWLAVSVAESSPLRCLRRRTLHRMMC
jgi:hypothetical protein